MPDLIHHHRACDECGDYCFYLAYEAADQKFICLDCAPEESEASLAIRKHGRMPCDACRLLHKTASTS